MSNVNSSGAVERFTLAAGESKVFQTEDPGGNLWNLDINCDNQGPSSIVALQSSETNGSYATVGSAVTVVPGGYAALSGQTGRWTRIINTGTGLAYVVAKPARIANGHTI
jgi:hypothetical protein